MRYLKVIILTLMMAIMTSPAFAQTKADHTYWPTINGIFAIQRTNDPATFVGSPLHDELLGHHGNDTIIGSAQADVLWADWDPNQFNYQGTHQIDHVYGGYGDDFIYGSHGYNVLYGGPGNDAIRAHYGRGIIDCGPGRDIYHVAYSRRKNWKIRNCERVSYLTESQGGVLKSLAH